MNDERKFLHDLSSPLAALQLYLETMAEDANQNLKEGEEGDPRYQKCLLLLEKMTRLIEERRAVVKKTEAA